MTDGKHCSELQKYYENLRTVREILVKEQQ
jgi:hypothetical protein